jgi:hypothetical protein
MSKERLQEIKKNVRHWRDWSTNTHAADLDLSDVKDIEWLISEVERLQAYIYDETVPKQFDTGHLISEKQHAEQLYTESQQKVERLEFAIKTALTESKYGDFETALVKVQKILNGAFLKEAKLQTLETEDND